MNSGRDSTSIPGSIFTKLLRENLHQATLYGGELGVRTNLSWKISVEGGISFSKNKEEETKHQLPYNPGMSAYLKPAFTVQATSDIDISGFVDLSIALDRSAWDLDPKVINADNRVVKVQPLADYRKLDIGVTANLNKRYIVYGNVYNLFGDRIETYDDAWTVYKGEPTYGLGLKVQL